MDNNENKQVTGAVETTVTENQDKTYTAAEVESMLDARISKAYEKWERKSAAKVTEAEK